MRNELTLPPGDGVIGLGMNLTDGLNVTFCGTLVSVRFTAELKVPIDVTVTVIFPHVPGLIIASVGLTAIEKSGRADPTVRVTMMLWDMMGRVELPVIVML